MTMTHPDPNQDALARLADAADEHSITHVSLGGIGAITKSEVEAQLDAAHRHKRSIKTFLNEAMTLATVTREVAETCIYALPRDGKMIAGPSVRLAEICASAYGNLHVGARIIDVEDTNVVAQGVAWDLEKNLRVTVETRRRITGKSGRRFSEDMITMTGNAAASIALRNAIFRVVPRAYVEGIYAKVRQVAVGDAQTLANRRAQILDRLQKIGVSLDRVLAKLEVKGAEDIGLEQLEVLIGLGTAIKNGEQTIDEAFPAPTPAPAAPSEDGKRISLGKKGKAEKATEPVPEKEEPKTAADWATEPPEPGSNG